MGVSSSSNTPKYYRLIKILLYLLLSQPSMTMAWRIINTSPAHHNIGTIITRRRALYNTRYFTAIPPLLSSSSSNNNQQQQNELLETQLRQLAKLNNGISVNPRSPRQVSNLLYNGYDILDSSSSTYNNGKSNSVTLGPTDKATLQQIILQDNDINSDGASHKEVDGQKQKEIAKLVLQCRELLATSNNNGSGRRVSNVQQSESFMSKATRGQQQLVEEEQVIPVDYDDTDKATTALPKAPSAYYQSTQLSPYEQMVMNLFPNIDNNVDNTSTSTDDIMTIDQYWLEPLLQLTKSNSRSLVQQLQATSCPMGYNQAANPLSSITLANSTTTTTTPVKRTTSLLSYIRTQKYNQYKDSIILVRVGDFYETYGIDAIMLVEYCGLNPMAGKARAGCPWRNIQSTLDGLTSVGYRVAVYEEWNGSGIMPKGIDEEQKKSGLKPRYLSQVVSSANPTYMHNLVLNDDSSAADDDNTPSSIHTNDLSSSSPGRYYVGVIETNAGYTLVEVSAEERTVVVSERLTAEAVSCRLVAYPPADPLFYVPPYTEDVVSGSGRNKKLDRLPFLPWRQQQSSPLASQRHGNGMMMGKVRVKTLPPSLVVSPRPGMTDVERSKQTIVSAFLRLEDDSSSLVTASSKEGENDSSTTTGTRRVVTHDDFLVVASTSSSSVDESDSKNRVTETHPLHLETATQLGLMSDPAIPPLISSLLPDSAPPSSRRFLRRWLLIPPPPHIADAMSLLTHTLKEENDKALPSLNAPPLTGKVISLIRAGQSSAAIYREILSALDAASEVLKLDDNIVNPLLKILHHDTGTEISDSDSLRTRFLDAMKIIERVVSTQNMEQLQNSNYNSVDDPQSLDYISYYGDVVPKAFFERNEAIWRGRVKPNTLEDAHKVDMAAKRLSEAIAIDFWGCDVIEYDDEGLIELYDAKETKNIVVTQDIFNNILAIKTIPEWVKTNDGEDSVSDKTNAKSRYFHPRDRNGKVLTTRYTTERVQDAMSEYVEACSSAREEVERVLTQLSWDIVDNDHLSAILQASHLNLILSTAAHHAASSNVKGWNVATIYDDDDDDRDSAGNFTGLWPYWMDKSESVSNSFDLNGLFLLTAPNMSGKSTLMRSTAAAALVANAGLCAPVGVGSSVKRFDSLFVRGASSDVPTEDKSAFGAEMGDVSALLRSCGEHSLVFVDEIGRGTSPKDGTSLAGAILEKMAEANMSGMFATHLHGILKLPYSSKAEERMIKKRMAITEDSSGQLNWTYKLEDGICTNSLALHTASKFGLPESIIKRAEELSHHWDADKDDHTHTKSSVTDYPAASDTTTSNSINHAATILEEIVGENSTRIPPSYITPPSYEGISCVYVLQVGDDEKRYYVGETDSLSQRLSQHRSKGKDWSSLSAIAVKVKEGKSTARNVESLVIQQMAKDGFNLVSITDGTSIKPKQAH